MKLSHDSEASPSFTTTKCSGPLSEIYKHVLLQFQDTKRHRNYGRLWSQVAPSGNIYRYNGLSQERMKHCLDLDQQLQQVAEEHKALLGDDAPLEERCDRLVKALGSTRATGLIDGAEAQEVPEGFLPLEEFLDTDVANTAGIIHPREHDARSRWFFNHLMAFLVFTIQTCGPLLVVIQLWHGPDNQLKHPDKMWEDLTLKHWLCLGKDRTGVLTTILGTMFLLLINIKIFNHCRDECANAEKMGRLPTDDLWSILGNTAQCLCSIFVVCAVPLEFWREDGTTGIMMNSMALLFIYTLDNLTGDVFGWLGEDGNEFQKQVCWNYALLAYCPVNLRDLIDPTATSMEKLWKISYDAHGNLLSASGAICQTRIMDSRQTLKENSPLVKKDTDSQSLEELVMEYRVGTSCRARHLPGWRARIISKLWFVTKLIIGVMAWTNPLMWFVLNKPCQNALSSAK